MKPIIEHFWKRNREQVLASSFGDCHARGVHSILLLKDPCIRLFIAAPEHDLWRNSSSDSNLPLSVGLHAHHCAITIEVVSGAIENVRQTGARRNPISTRTLSPYRYHSKPRGERPGFEFMEVFGSASWALAADRYLATDHFKLKASDYHTIGVARGESASWLVYEGHEDPRYQPITYSDADLTKFDFGGMYRPLEKDEIEDLLYRYG